MDVELKGAIEVLLGRIEKKSSEIDNLKKMVNSLCSEAGIEAMFSDVSTGSTTAATIRPDQFYGKSPTVAAREYLDLKGRAVPLSEILDALTRGGFDFDAHGWKSEGLRLKNLGISIGKNSSIFHRLPNDTLGLVKFYPEVEKRLKQQRGRAKQLEGAHIPSSAVLNAPAISTDETDETMAEDDPLS